MHARSISRFSASVRRTVSLRVGGRALSPALLDEPLDPRDGGANRSARRGSAEEDEEDRECALDVAGLGEDGIDWEPKRWRSVVDIRAGTGRVARNDEEGKSIRAALGVPSSSAPSSITLLEGDSRIASKE